MPKRNTGQKIHNLSNHWSQTVRPNTTQFHYYDNSPEADECVIIFSTEDHLHALATYDTWCMDGTFSVAPRLLHQLYVIHEQIGNVFLPLA